MEESVRTEGSERFRQSQIKGFNMGEARGIRQAKETVARNMIQEKFSADEIQRITKLPRKRLIELGLPS